MDIRVVGSPNKRSVVAMREKRLYEATLCGSVESLHELMREDKLVLARASLTCFNETHLHIAAMLGHSDFVNMLLGYNSYLVTKLDEHGRTPMHLASSAGHAEVIRLLVAVDADVCLVRDEDGRTPLHLAVMHGHLDVARELIHARPQVVSMRYTLARGETILHTCVVYNRLEVLKMLMSMSTIDDNFLNSKDDNGYTILHTSAALKHKEIIRYLVSEGCRVRVDAKNENGFTALDMMDQMPRDLKTIEITDLLVQAGGVRRDREINIRPLDQETQETQITRPPEEKSIMSAEKNRDAVMVVATVLADMAYQATLNPPGGLWQEPKKLVIRKNNTTKTLEVLPGTSILSSCNPEMYAAFWVLNTLTFGTALGIIFFLVSGISFRVSLRRFSMFILIMSMTLTYVVSLLAISPSKRTQHFVPTT